MSTRTFWQPKSGNAPSEYEDAGWPVDAVEREARRFRCAIADGATETSFSAEWAHLLVQAYGRGMASTASIRRHLPRLSQTWKAGKSQLGLPWYAEAKLSSGAYAALLGLTLFADTTNGAGGTWKALAVGDSCLFHVQGESIQEAFPVTQACDFNSRPRLLSTVLDTAGLAEDEVAEARGTWASGDRFYLMTDALAAWFLTAAEALEAPWEEVDCMAEYSDEGDFAQWIDDLRRSGALRNDDVTLLYIRAV